MSFIRPEIVAGARRWRESLAGAAAAAFGAWLAMTGTGAAAIVGTILVIGGALMVFAGLQRARFRRGAGGAGVVRLDEGRLVYLGPFEGGMVALEDLAAVDLATGPAGSVWLLTGSEGAPLRIPVDAEGAEALFDVFGALPGFDTAAMLRAVERPVGGRVMIWARSARGASRIGAH